MDRERMSSPSRMNCMESDRNSNDRQIQLRAYSNAKPLGRYDRKSSGKRANRGSARSKIGAARAALFAGLMLMMASCGRQDEGPLPPHSPPRPTTMMFGTDLMHAHYRLPVRPVPPAPGMM